MLLEFILIGGLFITALVLFLLARKKGSTSQGLLGILFITTFFFLLSFYADQNGIEWLFQIGLLGSNSIGFLLGPVLLLYATSAFRKQKRFPLRTLLHFFPFALHFALITFPLSLQGFDATYLFSYVQYWDTHAIAFSLIENCYFFLYVSIAFIAFQKGIAQMSPSKPTTLDNDLSWTRVLLICALLVQGLDIVVIVYELIWKAFPIDPGYITATTITLSSIYLVLHGINTSYALLQLPGVKPPERVDGPNRIALESFSDIEMDEFMETLEREMTEKAPYLSPTLSLKELAELSSIPINTLSAIINQQTGSTFNDFINGYRVESVKAKMASDDYTNYSLLGMALESGFQSKTSFYRSFKKHTGMTPAAFKKG